MPRARYGRLLYGACIALLAAASAVAAAPGRHLPPSAATVSAAISPAQADWPAWRQFADSFVKDDGRVVDWTAQAHTVSEGQGYAMFFALVAGDRDNFERIFNWTRDNLAAGDLHHHLPAWLWGQDGQGRWKVLDPNSASDADLWLAYDLFEAGRLWHRDDYTSTARALLQQVAMVEVAHSGTNAVLLPGPEGFNTSEGPRLNPSYVPPFQFSYFASVDPQGPWRGILDTYLAVLPDIAPSGCVPDWFVLTEDGPRKDSGSDGAGSYDAVRVYLWAGIGASGTAQDRLLRKVLKPYAEFVRKAGRLPERCHPDGRAPEGVAPAGIEAALLPFYQRDDAVDLLQVAQKRIDDATSSGLVGQPARYYEQALTLFGEGWIQQRYRFDSNGRLKTQ